MSEVDICREVLTTGGSAGGAGTTGTTGAGASGVSTMGAEDMVFVEAEEEKSVKSVGGMVGDSSSRLSKAAAAF